MWHVAYRARAAVDDQEVVHSGMVEIDKEIEVCDHVLGGCGPTDWVEDLEKLVTWPSPVLRR